MRILFDHNVPRFLRHRIRGHAVSTAAREGWDELSNGRLLAAAEAAGFDVLVTRDRDFLDLRLIRTRSIAVVLLVAQGQGRSALESLIDSFVSRIDTILPGTIVTIAPPDEGTPPPLRQ